MTSPNINRTNSLFSLFDSDCELFEHEFFKHESAGIGISSTMASNSSMYYLLFGVHISFEANSYIVKLLTGVLHLCGGVCWC